MFQILWPGALSHEASLKDEQEVETRWATGRTLQGLSALIDG